LEGFAVVVSGVQGPGEVPGVAIEKPEELAADLVLIFGLLSFLGGFVGIKEMFGLVKIVLHIRLAVFPGNAIAVRFIVGLNADIVDGRHDWLLF
jgi:hypothetical protein